jgi:hypothetical protein
MYWVAISIAAIFLVIALSNDAEKSAREADELEAQNEQSYWFTE